MCEQLSIHLGQPIDVLSQFGILTHVEEEDVPKILEGAQQGRMQHF